jgi:hypothetical protein
VPIYGPWQGRLQNSADNVELYRPDEPVPETGAVPYYLADKVRYTDSFPWPALADGATNGAGYSLSRRVSTAYGNEATNWVAALPTPGSPNGAGVTTPPSINSISPPQSVAAGGTASLVVGAFGSGLRVQWFLDGIAVPNATNTLLTLANFQAAQAGEYAVVIANGAGSAFAATRVDLRTLPVIARQPVDVGAPLGGTARLSVVAGGTPPLSYQWQFNSVNLPGANGAVLEVLNAQPADEGLYRVIVSNAFGSVTSSSASLVVQEPPSIVQQPAGADVVAGETVTLSVTVTGDAPLQFQWQRNGVNVPNATNATLVLANIRSTDAGSYRVLVNNLAGMIESSPAVVTVSLPPTITLFASDSSATENGGGGAFTLSRAGSPSARLSILISVSGNAGAGTDYQIISSPVIFPAGSNTIVVPVLPLDDGLAEGTETVVLSLQAGLGYEVGSPSSATVFITDDDNLPPIVTVTAPAAGTVYGAPATVLVTATASDPEGALSQVAFYLNGTNQIGTATTAPYAATVEGLPSGVYQLTAVATDGLGAFSVSAPVQFIVNNPPTVAITSPQNGAMFNSPGTVPIAVSAADTDGSVTRVEIYAGAALVTALTSAPYAYVWTNVSEGTYSLTARAVDNRGSTNTSVPVVIGVAPAFSDLFALRAILSGFTNRVRGTNSTYTREAGEPRHENRTGARSAWIGWQAPGSGLVRMNTFNSSFDTVLSIYTGSVVSNLVRVAGNDDANDFVVQSAASFSAVAGTTYQIAVDGFSATAGGVIDFQLELADLRPRITAQPQSITVNQGSPATFSVTATGTGPISYQWRFNGNPLNNATNSSFTRSAAQLNHEGVYSCIVSNANGPVASAGATLTVRPAPVITTQPLPSTVFPGDAASFVVVATGFAPLSYQWQRDGVNLPGATGTTLALANIQAADEGIYTVVVSNPVGSTTSAGAPLQVLDGLVEYDVFEILTMTNVWSYDQSGVDRGTAWRAPNFDDAAWPTGAGMFGFEDSVPFPYPFAILTPLTAPDNQGPVTVYFRTHFPFTKETSGLTLYSESFVDDGAIFYLNGAQIGRVRMGANATNYNSLATGVQTEGQSVFQVFAADSVVQGDNVFAVEVHQSSRTSSDVVFGLSLTAAIARTNQPVLLNPTRVGNGVAITLGGFPGRTYALESSPSFGGTWTRLVTFTNFTGQATFTDPSIPTATRYYRGRLVR